MRAEFDWMLEILKAVCVIATFCLLLMFTGRATDDIFVKDCKATGFYRAGDTVIECKVLAERKGEP